MGRKSTETKDPRKDFGVLRVLLTLQVNELKELDQDGKKECTAYQT